MEPSTSGRGGATQPTGSSLDRIGPTGDGMILYPSGNIAVVVCKQAVGHIITFMSNRKNGQVLASFDSRGVGGVNYPNGKPWLVVTEGGCTISDKSGTIAERTKWPRTCQEPTTFQVSEHLTVRFTDKQNITAHFSCDDINREWQCGETLKRREAYTSNVLANHKGKLELDVGAIRQRQRDVGSVYVPPGPHRQETERRGLGSLKKALRAIDAGSPLAAAVNDLRSLDNRMALLSTLPKLNSSSSSCGSTSRSGPLGLTGRSSLGSSLGSSSLEDYGCPVLSETQRKYQSTMRTVDYSKSRYKGSRLKLPLMRMRDVDTQAAGAGAPADTLVVLCLLAHWNPKACTAVEAQAEMAHCQLVAEAEANAGSNSAHVKMYKIDASESNLLQDRYGFRTVPMFLMYFEGSLVYASNAISSAAQARDAALSALARGRKKEFLPPGFRFVAGKDNALLDYIRPGMVLQEL